MASSFNRIVSSNLSYVTPDMLSWSLTLFDATSFNSNMLWGEENLNSTNSSFSVASRDLRLWALWLLIFPVLTFSGNVLVVLAVYRERALRNATNYFIVSLAVADIMVGILVMPLAVYVEVNHGEWFLGNTLCDTWVAFDVLCCTASIINLAAISVDRFIAVTQPIKYAKHQNFSRVYVTIVITWVVSVAISSPIALGVNNTEQRVNTDCKFYNSDFLIYSSMGSFYIPTIIMLLLYWRIFATIRARSKRSKGLHQKKKFAISTTTFETVAGNESPVPEEQLAVQKTDTAQRAIVTPFSGTKGGENTVSAVATAMTTQSSDQEAIDDYLTDDCVMPANTTLRARNFEPSYKQQNSATTEEMAPFLNANSQQMQTTEDDATSTVEDANCQRTLPCNHTADKEMLATTYGDHRNSATIYSLHSHDGTKNVVSNVVATANTDYLKTAAIDTNSAMNATNLSRSDCNSNRSQLVLPLDRRAHGSVSSHQDQSPIRCLMTSSTQITFGGRAKIGFNFHLHRHRSDKKQRNKKEKLAHKREKKATKTLTIVLGVFLFCWLPYFTINIINAICIRYYLHGSRPECNLEPMLFSFFVWLGYINSFLNPIIYTIFNVEFRRAFRSILLQPCTS